MTSAKSFHNTWCPIIPALPYINKLILIFFYCNKFQVGGDDNDTHNINIEDAISYMRHIPHDVTIISGDSVIIQLNIKTSSFNIIFPSLP